MPLWRGSQSPRRRRRAPAKALPRPTAAAVPRTSGSCLFTVRTVGSIHSVSVHVRCDGGGAAAALYNYTLMCIIVEKSGHTHTQYTLSYSYYTKCKTVYLFICTHMQGQRSSNIKIKLFFSHLKYTGKSYL